ncbi:PAS domain S-box protein [Desertibaculum subflavum]|uniref:PAS domain S-box protein n=1 Tax=Desertibaculum subflavum TaxID=2268458 RepID=UPI000E66F1F3
MTTAPGMHAAEGADPAPAALQGRFSQRQLLEALESMIQGIVIHRGKALYANPAMVDLAGLASREAFMASPSVIDFVHPDDQELVRAQAEERIETGVTNNYEFRIARPDGSIIWVDCRASRIMWDGEPAALASLADISARKRSELLFHTVFHASPDVMTLSTLADARYVEVNQTFLRVHGFRRDEVIGRTAQELGLIVDPTLRPRIAEILRKGGDVRDIVTTIRVPGGRSREFSLSAQRLMLDGREMLLIVARDVTERRQQEEALRRAQGELESAYRLISQANDELERRVQERTAALQSAQGELVKRERLSALGQLTATVAHELRNPLSAIRNTLFSTRELAAAKGVALDRPIGRMERSIERCNRIIADLLDFSRARELHCETHGFDGWLDGVVHDQVLPAGVELTLVLQAAGAAVSLDSDRLRRVVINLIDNAAQAMTDPQSPSAEKRLTLQTRALEGGIELLVADTGPGIAPENLERIFEPLFSTKSFGTGLGLPTVRQIVEQHGGTIHIESEVGCGTRIRVRLPLAQIREAAA